MTERLDLSAQRALEQEQQGVLQQLEDWLEIPMLLLGFVWLALFIVEIIWGLSSFLEAASTTIWIIFILDFAIKIMIAPRKWAYLKKSWLTVFSLLLPALRVFRVVHVAQALRGVRAVRGLKLLRVMTRTNRGMRALAASVNRRGFGYIVGLTLIVVLIGAAGMYTFENEVPNGLESYGSALWWTAMTITTMGSDYFPETPEGRVLCFLLALYAFAVFGYVTATIATFFVGRDAEDEQAEIAGAKSIELLYSEIKALRAEVQALSSKQSIDQQ
ncbi:potassium channel family protein [Pseudanabaena sp. FACHB-2040]|uniref:potassium channel family protein n=1 Tax=Pseudanabaena sp. FACHB-2040 TaxID=2692859 RepID=UPI00168A346E|nr:potassium channel family protein [Pseudanabaena sp. FACHB-2040]MBD2258042.1 ion transporter [Pseudanabaena sp. FACHB-2040]